VAREGNLNWLGEGDRKTEGISRDDKKEKFEGSWGVP
jgi:hypothetical protein